MSEADNIRLARQELERNPQASISELRRKYGVSKTTLYRWRDRLGYYPRLNNYEEELGLTTQPDGPQLTLAEEEALSQLRQAILSSKQELAEEVQMWRDKFEQAKELFNGRQ